MLPNFLIIGAAKAGTTSLYHYLRVHPQVFMPATKELNFFVESGTWAKGRAWYERQFQAAGDAAAVGEASPNYTKHPLFAGVPGRIARLIPEVRLIYLVRHPIQRFRSGYLDEVRRGRQPNSIEASLRTDPSIFAASNYGMQIEQYLEHFPREQLLVLAAEDLRERRAATLSRVHAFLGVEDLTPSTVTEEFNRMDRQRSVRPVALRLRRLPGVKAVARLAPAPARRLATRPLDPARGAISPTFEDHLRGLLRDDLRRLRAYLGDEFDDWAWLI
jgi:hypothetical protein